MGKINKLEPNVFNMISAGEVVERPSSVVKELVENSIDAGATEIDIFIQEGGIKKIQVSDNGIGIMSEDVRAAFLPHATSKLKYIADLDCISTLGFRGEALASIASVSEITLITKCKAENFASKITINGGKVLNECLDSRNEGTLICVENLFFNTPARLKFLKKASSEQHYVYDTVKMLTLANPNVSITLHNDDRELLSHVGGNLIDALYSVYEVSTVDKLWQVDNTAKNGIKVSGYTSSVEFTKPNRTYQTIIVNGRTVEDVTITTAVEKAYSEFLMKRAYPMFVLDIIIPFSDVDANVHPSKTEVRFRDKQSVFSAVYHAISNTITQNLSNCKLGFNINSSNKNIANETQSRDDTTSIDDTNRIPNTSNRLSSDGFVKQDYFTQSRLDTSALFKPTPQNEYDKYLGIDFADLNEISTRGLNDRQSKIINIQLNDNVQTQYNTIDSHKINQKNLNSKFNDNLDNQQAQFNKETWFQPVQEYRVFDGKIIGQIFDTYILIERDELIYIIDQHAAHERILYDKLVKNISNNISQPLLIPYKYKPNGDEADYLESIIPNLASMGFEIVHNGEVYLINAVPQAITSIDFGKFFSELFANMPNENEITLANLIKEKICQQACKAAIKGGESLSREQIEYVIKNYVDNNGDLPQQCPHGRPAIMAFTKHDIEKLFKRII